MFQQSILPDCKFCVRSMMRFVDVLFCRGCGSRIVQCSGPNRFTSFLVRKEEAGDLARFSHSAIQSVTEWEEGTEWPNSP